MSCEFETAVLQNATNSGDGTAVKKAAVNLAICKLQAAKRRLIDGQIGNAGDLAELETEIAALRYQRQLLELQNVALPMIGQPTLQAFQDAIFRLETAVAQGAVAAAFIAAAGALRGAAAGLA